MRALRDFNVPKIVADDSEIFSGLLGDLFPGIIVPRKVDINLEKAIADVCKETGLYEEPEFILKVVQLSELLEIRHCVFCMGNPGAAKSSTWKTLSKAQDKVSPV
jgi:dynein heavy chain